MTDQTPSLKTQPKRSKTTIIARIAFALVALVVSLGLLLTAVVFVQGQRKPTGSPVYVALGSSFAAGAGLGNLEAGSPWACARSVNGYPQRLARLRNLPIVDMSCSGAVTRHLLAGGQYFQGPQVRTVTSKTRLVTITTGGNDIGYVADLSLIAASKSKGPIGWIVRTFWKAPASASDRDLAALRVRLVETLRAIHERAPDATVVLATYPAILPAKGTCDKLAMTSEEAQLMRSVANSLAETTRSAAVEGDALFVDMNEIGSQHHACSEAPWTNGWRDAAGQPFHPTQLGATETAAAISRAMNSR